MFGIYAVLADAGIGTGHTPPAVAYMALACVTALGAVIRLDYPFINLPFFTFLVLVFRWHINPPGGGRPPPMSQHPVG
jgi:hypothetical protein